MLRSVLSLWIGILVMTCSTMALPQGATTSTFAQGTYQSYGSTGSAAVGYGGGRPAGGQPTGRPGSELSGDELSGGMPIHNAQVQGGRPGSDGRSGSGRGDWESNGRGGSGGRFGKGKGYGRKWGSSGKTVSVSVSRGGGGRGGGQLRTDPGARSGSSKPERTQG